ncbi:MAG TPA: 50S ribosomal protein L22 [Candidatus Avidehalobacter gallistercoris]|uniref:Large ribosomal subunit protein uL22 n=1 Tax=Candidatus Avidehalobacter gallistercoris TaxID=2840694 RepID=A0A9D1HLR8_9FIRM|nr:50S ribosomal protein L22 [Candidatus Avidehalobacter gallistercoris]
MEAKAIAKYVRMSPRKARLVANLIKGKDIQEAQAILRYTPNKAARVISKVMLSAAANAENNLGLDKANLIVKGAVIDQGPSIKRIKPRAQGRADRMVHRTSHVTVVVAEREEA